MQTEVQQKSGAETWIEKVFSTGLDTLQTPARMDQPFVQHPTVYRVMSAFARNVSRIPYEVFKGESDEAIKNHPVTKLLSKPNGRMHGNQIFEYTTLHMEHYGNSVWRLGEAVRSDNTGTKLPASIELLPPPALTPHQGTDGEIDYFEYRAQGRIERVSADQVLHFKHPSPYSDINGVSWLQAARTEFETDYFAQRWNRQFFINGAEPNGVLQPTGDHQVNDEDIEPLRAQWMEKHGGIRKAHAPAVLPTGLEYVKTGIGQREMDFAALRKGSRENVLVAAGMPPGMASIMEFANYANMQPQLRIFFELELMPRLSYIEGVLQADLLDRFAPGIVGKFKTEVIQALLEDLNIKADVATKLWSIGVPLTLINERLDLKLDLDDVEGADEPHLPPAGLFGVPEEPDGTEDDARPQKPPVDDEEPEEDALMPRGKRLVGEQMRSAVWRGLIASVRDLELKADSRYRDHLRSLRNDVLRRMGQIGAKGVAGNGRTKRLVESDIESLLFDLRAANEEVILLIEPIYRGAIKRGAETVSQQTGTSISLDFLDPAVVQILTNRRRSIKGTNERMREELRETIAEGVRAGEAEADVAERVRDYFNGERRNARTVARTEVHSSFSAARVVSMEQAGIERHEWLSSRDDVMRKDHEDEDKSVVLVGSRFPITGLAYPLEPGGAAAQVINCRCVTVPIVEG